MKDGITLIYRSACWAALGSIVASATVLLVAASPGWAVEKDREFIRVAHEGPEAETVEAPIAHPPLQMASTSR